MQIADRCSAWEAKASAALTARPIHRRVEGGPCRSHSGIGSEVCMHKRCVHHSYLHSFYESGSPMTASTFLLCVAVSKNTFP
jgi:hypothetical protein